VLRAVRSLSESMVGVEIFEGWVEEGAEGEGEVGSGNEIS
jgi:hypothetical protein